MNYSPRTDLFRTDIQPDTQGMAPGITAAGNAFAGALQNYGQNKRQDAQHKQLREEQLADYGMRRADRQEDMAMLREQNLADYSMRRGDAKEDKALEREFQKQQEADAAAGVLEGVMRLYGPQIPQGLRDVTKNMSPKGQLEFAQQLGRFATQQKAAEQANTPPAPWSAAVPGHPDQYMFGVGKSALGKGGGTAPGLEVKTTPSGEQIYTYGNDVVNPSNIYRQRPGPYAPGNGLEPLVPQAPPKEVFPVWREDANGVLRGIDRRTGAPISAAPKTAKSYYE